MVNINQNENENEETKLSPLGTDEINSVIKSFKTSTFNQEELYVKDKKNFVKKTLFDLAKESERITAEGIQSEIDDSSEKKNVDDNVDLIQEIDNKPDKKNDLDNIHSTKQNNENNSKEAEYLKNEVSESIKSDEVLEEKSKDEPNKSDEVLEEKSKDEPNKSDEVLEENIDQNVSDADKTIVETKSTEPNKIEYEEKTLEALDSVREAVTKSLEQNIDTQNEDIVNNTDVSKNLKSNIFSEINLINSLFRNIREISNEEIENVVKSKVIELAEGVIGYQIEKFPDKFLKKIKNNINELKSINNNVMIYLNDKDFDLLSKYLESNELEINFKLDSDASLGRGDFTIDMGGVIQAIKYKKIIE